MPQIVGEEGFQRDWLSRTDPAGDNELFGWNMANYMSEVEISVTPERQQVRSLPDSLGDALAVLLQLRKNRCGVVAKLLRQFFAVDHMQA